MPQYKKIRVALLLTSALILCATAEKKTPYKPAGQPPSSQIQRPPPEPDREELEQKRKEQARAKEVRQPQPAQETAPAAEPSGRKRLPGYLVLVGVLLLLLRKVPPGKK